MTEQNLRQGLCAHLDFTAHVDVTRLTDSGRFAADVRVQCAECLLPFEFIGLQIGLRLDAPMMSVDGQEARLPIKPAGTETPKPDGPMGFNIRVVDDPQ